MFGLIPHIFMILTSLWPSTANYLFITCPLAGSAKIKSQVCSTGTGKFSSVRFYWPTWRPTRYVCLLTCVWSAISFDRMSRFLAQFLGNTSVLLLCLDKGSKTIENYLRIWQIIYLHFHTILYHLLYHIRYASTDYFIIYFTYKHIVL